MPQTPTMNFTDSVDYDISSINNVYLPVAIVANKAGVGYIGTVKDLTTFDTDVTAFANGSILNGYFGGKGWPIYYTSDPGKAPDSKLIKLVGTKNIFSDNTAASSYDLLKTASSSSAGNKATGGVLKPTNGDYAEEALIDLWFGWLNYYANLRYANHGQSLDAGTANTDSGAACDNHA